MVFKGNRQNPVKHTHDKLCWCYEGHKSYSGRVFPGISFIDGGLRGFLWMHGCTLRAPGEDISYTGRAAAADAETTAPELASSEMGTNDKWSGS